MHWSIAGLGASSSRWTGWPMRPTTPIVKAATERKCFLPCGGSTKANGGGRVDTRLWSCSVCACARTSRNGTHCGIRIGRWGLTDWSSRRHSSTTIGTVTRSCPATCAMPATHCRQTGLTAPSRHCCGDCGERAARVSAYGQGRSSPRAATSSLAASTKRTNTLTGTCSSRGLPQRITRPRRTLFAERCCTDRRCRLSAGIAHDKAAGALGGRGVGVGRVRRTATIRRQTVLFFR